MHTVEPDFRVERMRPEDFGENVVLAREVGWPDTEGDWHVIHEAAIFFGARANGNLVTQGRFVSHDVRGRLNSPRSQLAPLPLPW